ncbi:MAG: ATP-binding cassette domain-containing protein [Rhabdochlamydiaceae bacterium]|nr:ATP-binding cassette domain-containing protein [Rhabdochlamydiaceae bacterium]
MLKTEKLTLKKEKNEILKEITLEIPRGRTTLLLGKSGSGKTTLLRCLAQLEKPTSGAITYEGTPLSTKTRKQKAQLIGFVAQSYPLFPHMTALDNCAHPLKSVYRLPKELALDKARQMLDRFSLGCYCKAFPSTLSGGQQQRVALARALLLDPAFLLFDEPTSALDPENTELLTEMIQERCQEGKAVVIASQDMVFASKVVDIAYFLEKGRCCEEFDLRKTKQLNSESKLKEFLFL